MKPLVVICAGLENLRSVDVRLLDEASRLGSLHVRLWSDALAASIGGAAPRFTQAERRFFVRNLRYVDGASIVERLETAVAPIGGRRPDKLVALQDAPAADRLRALCAKAGVEFVEIGPKQLEGFPAPQPDKLAADDPKAKRVLVTGCYDWLHSGHVEFFRDAATHGELYVVAGSDRNVRLLKGDGHPLHDETERVYMVQAMRPVHRALVSTGSGWMDAEPEIGTIKPHRYVVNEDGDKPEKREFCDSHDLEYVILHRKPHKGLPRRSSTDLRGF